MSKDNIPNDENKQVQDKPVPTKPFFKNILDTARTIGNTFVQSKPVRAMSKLPAIALSLLASIKGHGISIAPPEIGTDAEVAGLAKMGLERISTKNRILNGFKTVAYHAAKIASSKPVGIIAKLVGAGISIAAIASGGPITAGVAAGLALTSVVAKVAVDTVQARSFNKLKKENDRLCTFTKAINGQTELLNANPELSTKLEGVLVTNQSKAELASTKHSIASNSQVAGLGAGKAALKIAADVGNATLDVVSAVSGGIGSIVVKAGGLVMQAVSFGFLAHDTTTVDKLRTELKRNINSVSTEFRITYKNSRELKDQVRSQRIQTEALQKLTEELKSPIPPQDIKQRFQDLRREIEATEKAPNRNIFVRIGKAMFGVAKDVVRSQNPYSDYNNPGSFKIQKPEKSKETPELKQKSDSAKDLKEGTKDPKAVVETSVLENVLKNKDPGLIESFRNKPKQQSVGIGK